MGPRVPCGIQSQVQGASASTASYRVQGYPRLNTVTCKERDNPLSRRNHRAKSLASERVREERAGLDKVCSGKACCIERKRLVSANVDTAVLTLGWLQKDDNTVEMSDVYISKVKEREPVQHH